MCAICINWRQVFHKSYRVPFDIVIIRMNTNSLQISFGGPLCFLDGFDGESDLPKTNGFMLVVYVELSCLCAI